MPNFAQIIEEAMPVMRNAARARGGACSTMENLCNRERALFKQGQLQTISDFLSTKGFKDLEYLGSGSNAVAVAPLDNKNLVIRIREFGHEHRARIPHMLQTIGEPAHVCGVFEDGRMLGGYELEFLKRLDMDVPKDALNKFTSHVSDLGYKVDSMAGGSEVGWYRYKNAMTNREYETLMAADPSALSKGTAKDLPVAKGHPSLLDQLRENKRICTSDDRLSFLLADVEKQIESAPACRPVANDDVAQPWADFVEQHSKPAQIRK